MPNAPAQPCARSRKRGDRPGRGDLPDIKATKQSTSYRTSARPATNATISSWSGPASSADASRGRGRAGRLDR